MKSRVRAGRLCGQGEATEKAVEAIERERRGKTLNAKSEEPSCVPGTCLVKGAHTHSHAETHSKQKGIPLTRVPITSASSPSLELLGTQ